MQGGEHTDATVPEGHSVGESFLTSFLLIPHPIPTHRRFFSFLPSLPSPSLSSPLPTLSLPNTSHLHRSLTSTPTPPLRTPIQPALLAALQGSVQNHHHHRFAGHFEMTVKKLQIIFSWFSLIGSRNTSSRDVALVDGRLAVSRAFGDKSSKKNLSSEPYVTVEMIHDDAEFIILASDG